MSEAVFSYNYAPKVNKELHSIRDKYLKIIRSEEIIKMNKNDKEFLVQKIRTQYTERENTQLDELKALDAKVKKPANAFGYVFGAVSAIIMGAGMSLVMTDIGEHIALSDPMLYGIVIGVAGMIMALLNYPMYKGILNSRKKKYRAEILELSDKIMNK